MPQTKEKECFPCKEISCEISGSVQRVGLRTFIKSRADELGVVGYVENNEDSSVSVVAQGEKEKLEQFIEFLKKGSIFSKVDNVSVTWHTLLQDSFTEFSIK